MDRPELDEYFMKIALVIAERSTCTRHHVGAVAVRNKHILATGYNGAVAGLPDCLSLGCLKDALKIPTGERQEVCRAVHAELNVIIQAGLHGVSMVGAHLYCTHAPCTVCAKALANSGIARFVYCIDYEGSDALPLLDAGVVYVGHALPDLDIHILK